MEVPLIKTTYVTRKYVVLVVPMNFRKSYQIALDACW